MDMLQYYYDGQSIVGRIKNRRDDDYVAIPGAWLWSSLVAETVQLSKRVGELATIAAPGTQELER